MTADGSIDLPAVARLLAWFRSHDCAGVVLAGTNGEGPSLSATEKRDLVKTVVPLAGGMKVILGISTPSTDEAVWLCKKAHDSGAHAALVMAPGFFRDASEKGIEGWFRFVMDRSPVGMIVYNFPKRTGFTFSPELMARLSTHHRMIGLKDSSGSEENVSSYLEALAGSSKNLFVGDETLLVKTLQAGWTGTISGAANVLPLWLSQIVADWDINKESAETKFEIIRPALAALRAASQPATNKAILERAGILPSASVRLPLVSAGGEAMEAAWKEVGKLVTK